MDSSTCVFCKIIRKEIASTVICENDHVIVINNIAPQAPIHYLILPKKHIDSLMFLTDQDKILSWEMLKVARDLSSDLPSKSFNLIANNGVAAGQSVFHLHFHFLSGKNLYDHGFRL